MRFIYSPELSELLWGLPRLRFSVYPGYLPGGNAAWSWNWLLTCI